ncbi:LexA family protein [Cupriavidus sp. YAF13]|uniref:LexA family protein n=1 Tax=Cupriavidus sp. YAF13 TaxID=3233075 RepID=UPI003F911074
MATVSKRPLSAEEQADAGRLKAAWQAYQATCRDRGESPTQEWLGSVTNLGKQSVVGQYLRGVIPLNLRALVAICAAIGARPEEISPSLTSSLRDITRFPGRQGHPTAEGGISTEADAYNRPSSGDNFEPGPDLKPRRYPEISWVQAGMWTEIGENFAPGEAVDWHLCPYDLGERGFVVRVKGVSMTAPVESRHSFPEGTLLFINPDLEALPGKFVVVRRNGKVQTEATFKRLTLVDGEPFLEALNPAWPNRYVRVEAGDHFCGVVVFAGMQL